MKRKGLIATVVAAILIIALAVTMIAAYLVQKRYVVLDWQDGQAVAIRMVYRALLMLKGDGTFSWSSGAADNGFGRMLPGWYGYSLQVDGFMEPDESGGIVYRVNGQEVEKSVYDGVLVHQNAKPDAIWYGGDRIEGSIG